MITGAKQGGSPRLIHGSEKVSYRKHHLLKIKTKIDDSKCEGVNRYKRTLNPYLGDAFSKSAAFIF